jgi:hypothetical protein
MKPRVNLKVVAMMAACAMAAGIGAAHAQGMPEPAQQLVQTMRPMQPHKGAPEHDANARAQTTDDSAYGGSAAGASASASRRDAETCAWTPACSVFFGH